MAHSPTLVDSSRARMREAGFVLDLRQSRVVLQALVETSRFRGWGLVAVHVRSTHVHVVVSLETKVSDAVRDFKAYASRALNQMDDARRRWARGYSVRCLRTSDAVRGAVKYVADDQGAPMAAYVDPEWRG